MLVLLAARCVWAVAVPLMANLNGLPAVGSFSVKLTVAVRVPLAVGGKLHAEGRAAANRHRTARLTRHLEIAGVGSADRDRAQGQGRGAAVGNRVGLADRTAADRRAAKCRVVGRAGGGRSIGDRVAATRQANVRRGDVHLLGAVLPSSAPSMATIEIARVVVLVLVVENATDCKAA